MKRLVLRAWRIPHLPIPQHTGVIRQNRKAQPLVFHELLCFCSDALCVECCFVGRLVRAEMKICHQLPRRIIGRKLKQLVHKVDHIPMCAAGEAMIMVVSHIQAGVPVIVKGAEGFAISIHIDPIQFCRLPQIDIFFYDFKNTHDTSISAQKRRPARSVASRRLRLFLCCFRFFLVLSFSQGFLSCALPLDLCCIPTIVTAIFHI